MDAFPPSTVEYMDTDPDTRKFGKQIQKRQLEVPEYAASFVNYKALKKVWRSQSVQPPIIILLNDSCTLAASMKIRAAH
jgi:hypothetical protein